MHDRDHSFYMHKAIKQAERALLKNEVPIGAVVIDTQQAILGRGYNQVEMTHTQTAHAEMLALKKAAQRKENWRLEGCTLYVTLEPCAMCMNLVLLSRITTVVYGAPSPQFGYHLDNCLALNLYQRKLEIISGICRDEAAHLLQLFFRRRRKGA